MITIITKSTSNTCCFIGHKRINETKELRTRVRESVERLITQEKAETFLFGSNSRFDSLCLELVTEIKEKHPHVKRIYVRAEYPVISDTYREYILRSYDGTYYPDKIRGSGRAAYVERNREMIDRSRICIVYYDESSPPSNRKSGTKAALDYAKKKGREIILI